MRELKKIEITQEAQKKYKCIYAAVKKELTNRIKDDAERLKEFSFKNQRYYFERFLTARQVAKIETKELTEAAAKKIILNSLKNDNIKYYNQKIALLNKIALNNETFNIIKISVNWVNNKTWGYNPTAEVCAVGCGYETGRASGCGYDKRSSAISEALNKIDAVKKLLLDIEEKQLRNKATKDKSRRERLGYGSGCGVIPYFEGGCGVSVYYEIFKNCGFEFAEVASGKMFDAYTVTRINKGGKK